MAKTRPTRKSTPNRRNPSYKQKLQQERKEHPWLTKKQAERIVQDHERKAA